MKFEWPWKRQKITLEEDLRLLENKLEAFFQPVTPRVEFVKKLRVDLVGKPKRSLFTLPEGKWQRVALLAGGIVSLVGMVLGGIRLIAAVILLIQGGRKKMIKTRMPKGAIAA